MGDKPEDNTKAVAQNAPIFITQEQFETATNKLVEKFVSARQEDIAKLTEALKIVIPAKPTEPSSPVADAAPAALTREQKFQEEMLKVAEWFGKAKNKGIKDLAGIGWDIPKDIYLKRMGYDVDSDLYHSKATEAVTMSSVNQTKFVRKFILLKGSRFITPVRQYCDFQQLDDEDTARWYSFDGLDFGAVTEGTSITAASQTISKIEATVAIRGARQTIGYSQIEDSPAPLVDAINSQFVVAGLVDESKDLLSTVLGAATPTTNHWVNGETGAVITSFNASGISLTLDGVLSAKRRIIDSYGDPAQGNLVLFCSTQQYEELLLDVLTHTQYTRASEVDQGTMERVAGCDIVVTNNIKFNDTTTNDEWQAILAVKGEAFGMTSARDISLEASRRNELQQVYLTGTQRVKSKILNDEAWARLSTTKV